MSARGACLNQADDSHGEQGTRRYLLGNNRSYQSTFKSKIGTTEGTKSRVSETEQYCYFIAGIYLKAGSFSKVKI